MAQPPENDSTRLQGSVHVLTARMNVTHASGMSVNIDLGRVALESCIDPQQFKSPLRPSTGVRHAHSPAWVRIGLARGHTGLLSSFEVTTGLPGAPPGTALDQRVDAMVDARSDDALPCRSDPILHALLPRSCRWCWQPV